MGKLLVVCGPTATGKSDIAVNCALKLGSEVVSADSQLVYKGLNIGTAKPTSEEMRGIKHHMIDIVSPKSEFSVSDYMRLSEPVVDGLLKNGKIPVVCGGTGFYINSLLFDFSYGNVAADCEVRKKYEKIAEENGKEYVFNLLRSIDKETAEKLHVNDVKRVIRALEIYESSGVKKSDIRDGKKMKRNYFAVAVDYPREELYERINLRVDKMFKNGLVDEIKKLLDGGISENSQCMQAIGYKEVIQGLKNKDNLSTMRDIIKQNTRRYAKRQITFFKQLDKIKWLSPNEATAERILELYYNAK